MADLHDLMTVPALNKIGISHIIIDTMDTNMRNYIAELSLLRSTFYGIKI